MPSSYWAQVFNHTITGYSPKAYEQVIVCPAPMKPGLAGAQRGLSFEIYPVMSPGSARPDSIYRQYTVTLICNPFYILDLKANIPVNVHKEIQASPL